MKPEEHAALTTTVRQILLFEGQCTALNTRLADAMDNLSDSDRRFLADEFGIEEWREVA